MPSPLPPTAPALPRRLADATRNGFAATRAGFAGGRAQIGRVSHHARDMFAPLIAVHRGLRRATRRGRTWWAAADTNHRQAAAAGVAAALVVLYFVPYGLPAALVAVVLGAAWLGRTRRVRAVPGPPPGGLRLQAVYNGLVPHLSDGHDPEELFAPGGDYAKPFEHHEFEGDRLTRLEMRYSPFFTDDDPASRARIERVIETKVGRCREYLYDWDTENNRLTVAALPPLPGPVPAQQYVTAPCEIVLGFTDATSTNRLIPVTAAPAGAEAPARELPPVIWRAGSRTSAPHLLVVAGPASGKTTLLRTIALQALRDGEVIAMDATGSGEFAYLAGRAGVLRTDNTADQIRTTLSWLHAETARRAAAISAAKAAATPVPDAVRRPLLVLLDEPAELADATGSTVSEVYELLDLPLRLGRTTHISLVTTVRPSRLGRLHPGLLAETHTRVALGPLDTDTLVTALGAEPGIAGGDAVPPGRGFARIGAGPVIRIQTPYTPDPLEDDTPEADRRRILDLLPDVVLRDLPPRTPVTPNAHVTGGAVVTKSPGEPTSPVAAPAMSLTKTPLTKTH